ncbi:hypothetical protein LCGC14_0303230 [marine sediment metagenome]|uniref:Uncharacterized protein n=1 Tax=marine sediment metagenome TaxID=412755 RepID=A0A0F9U6V4_9ZZZZ
MTELNFKKLPYTDTTVSIHKSKANIERLLKEIGALGIQWTESFEEPIKLLLRVKFSDYIANFEIQLSSHPNKLQQEKQQKQVYRAYYWYFHGLVKFIRFGLVDVKDVFLPYAFIPSLNTTVREALDPSKLDGSRLLTD